MHIQTLLTGGIAEPNEQGGGIKGKGKAKEREQEKDILDDSIEGRSLTSASKLGGTVFHFLLLLYDTLELLVLVSL